MYPGTAERSGKRYFYGVFASIPQPELVLHDTNFYQSVKFRYCIITTGFCAYAVGRLLLSKTGFSNAACILALSVTLNPFRYMFIYKYKREIINLDLIYATSSRPYFHWLKISVYFDWFLLFSALILLFTQIILMITSKTEARST